MKIWYLRHQAYGVLHDHPFDHPPTQAELAPLHARCKNAHGTHHQKTGEEFWSKVIVVDTDLPHDDPERTKTVSCGAGGPAEDVNAKASGHCPIRAGDVEVKVCPHGLNDLALCDKGCAALLVKGYTRSDIELMDDKDYAAALESDKPAPVNKAELRVSVSGIGHVENPK